MAGLSNMLTNKEISSESMPSWFSTAQENAVTDISSAVTPAIADTAAQSAINAFKDSTSPFKSGQTTLEAIGSGAANPWLASGQPNKATPLGGLFAAQTEQAKQFMPEIDTAQTARNIAGGDFGSAMNLGGVSRARSNFLTDLYQKQMQSALQNQQTGVAAGSALGNVGNQLVQSALNTGTFQQNAPFASALNQASVLGKLQVPKSTTKSMDLGFLNQIGALGSLISGGVNALNDQYIKDPKTGALSKKPGLLSQLGVKGGLTGLYNKVTGAFSGSSGDAPSVNEDAGAYNPDTGMTDYIGADGNQVSIDANGNYYDEAGNMIWSPSWGESTDESYEEDNMNGGDSGGGGLEDESGYYDDYSGGYVPETYESNYGSGYDD